MSDFASELLPLRVSPGADLREGRNLSCLAESRVAPEGVVHARFTRYIAVVVLELKPPVFLR